MSFVNQREIDKEIDKLLESGEISQVTLNQLRSKLKELQLTKKELKKIIDETVKEYKRALVEPGEAVGTVAAQSIGEPGTQMSLAGDELVLIKKGGYTDIVPIGEFIDEFIMNSKIKDKPVGSSESVIFNVPDHLNIHVLSLGSDEKVQWRRLIQVSRHPPNGALLRLTTRSGRTISATASHSFITRKDNRIIPIKGAELKCGDRIPLVHRFSSSDPIHDIPLELYLHRNELLGCSELHIDSYLDQNNLTEQDHFYQVSANRSGLLLAIKTDSGQTIKQGYPYPKTDHDLDTKLPESFELNPLSGWFIGAYLAEGLNSSIYLSIANKDKNYQENFAKFAESLGLNYCREEKSGVLGPTSSVKINSAILAKLLIRMCGEKLDEKHIPNWALNANIDFIKGLLRGYFDGNGNIDIEREVIVASSDSKRLRDGICLMLARLGICADKSYSNGQYNLTITSRYIAKYREEISSDLEEHRVKLNKIILSNKDKPISNRVQDPNDVVPGIGLILNQLCELLAVAPKSLIELANKQEIGRGTLGKYIKLFKQKAKLLHVNIDREISILEKAYYSDIIWDEIIKIEKIDCPTEFVYDFSVDGLETFMTGEGLITHNTLKTFHYAGAAEFNVTLGLPRLEEILDAKKNPSTPMMEVYLVDDIKRYEDKVKDISRKIELTKIENVAFNVEIDLANMLIKITLDPELMEDKGVTYEEIKKQLEDLNKGEVTVEGNIVKLDPGTNDLAELQQLLQKIQETTINGLKGVNRVVIRKEGDEYVISTEGSNLGGVLSIPGVDIKRTSTNHIGEIAEVLGIEAARNAIIREAVNVLEEQGLDVDVRHIMLVADLMTFDGDVKQIGRHGISGKKPSVLARAAFEKTVQNLFEASIRGDVDALQGIAENVIIGQIIPVGTGSIGLLMERPKKED